MSTRYVANMDAPHDRDVELQKESGDLIRELKTKLPPLLFKSRTDNNDNLRPHRWAKSAKVDKLIGLVRIFFFSMSYLRKVWLPSSLMLTSLYSLILSKNGRSFWIRTSRS